MGSRLPQVAEAPFASDEESAPKSPDAPDGRSYEELGVPLKLLPSCRSTAAYWLRPARPLECSFRKRLVLPLVPLVVTVDRR